MERNGQIQEIEKEESRGLEVEEREPLKMIWTTRANGAAMRTTGDRAHWGRRVFTSIIFCKTFGLAES